MKPVFRMSRWPAVFALVLLSMGLASPGTADLNQAEARAMRYNTVMRNNGYAVRSSWHWGRLAAPGSRQVTRMTLYAGTEYVLVAAGDDNAYDLDLRLYDENGNLVAWDYRAASDAAVTITPRWTGPFRAYVNLHSGSSSGAYYVLSTGYR